MRAYLSTRCQIVYARVSASELNASSLQRSRVRGSSSTTRSACSGETTQRIVNRRTPSARRDMRSIREVRELSVQVTQSRAWHSCHFLALKRASVMQLLYGKYLRRSYVRIESKYLPMQQMIAYAVDRMVRVLRPLRRGLLVPRPVTAGSAVAGENIPGTILHRRHDRWQKLCRGKS
jgi:hypothetical protein